MSGESQRPVPVTSPMARPAAAIGHTARLTAWDDYPLHQTPELMSGTPLGDLGFAERFYFNVIRPSGEIVAIVGGGAYPARGAGEWYFCRLEEDVQINVREWRLLPGDGDAPEPGSFSFECIDPLRDWSVDVAAAEGTFAGIFRGSGPPFPYEAIEVPPRSEGEGRDFFRHFVAAGTWELQSPGDGEAGLVGVRDRTWGIRTRRARLHNWYVIKFPEACLAVLHQELADGSIHVSQAGLTRTDGSVEALQVASHELRFDADTRQLKEGELELTSSGGPLSLSLTGVGHAIRLSGAGFNDRQGNPDGRSGIETDSYDLADPEVARHTGRGTLDAGVQATVSGAWDATGVGVAETAVARDHVKYGSQIA